MDDMITRFWSDLVGRVGGPFSVRFILQPTMATIYAFRDGLKDAHEGRPFYFRTIVGNPSLRGPLLREGAKAVSRVIGLGIIMDAAYQLIEFRWLYPTEMVIIVLLLAFVPYVIVRGLVNRAARMRSASGKVAAR